MKTRATELLGRIRAAWANASPVKRWLVVGLAAALLVAVGLGYYLNRPQWVVLVSDAEPEDAAAIASKLDDQKIPYRPTGDGYTIAVQESDFYTAKLALAEAGLLNSGTVGMELFNDSSFGETDFDKCVKLLRAQQGELERALMRIDEIKYANVKLAIPEESVFVREQKPVTAAILVETKPGAELTRQQVQGIINFVASSVEGLDPENIQVVDQSGKLLSAGLDGSDEDLLAEADDSQLQRQQTLQEQMEYRVQTLLEPVFGAGNVVSRVHLELNLDSSRVESQTVEGATPSHTSTTQEMSTGLTGQAVGLSGDAAGAPVYQTGDQTSNSGQVWKQTTETDYGLSQSTKVTVTPPGDIKRISVGVVINQPSLTAEQIASIQQTVAGATGAQTDAVSVIAMAFNQGEAEEENEPAAETFKAVNPLVLGVGAGLALVLLLVGVIVTRRRRRAAEQALASAVEPAPGMTTGAALDVALGLDQAAPAAGEEQQAAPTEEAAAPPEEAAPEEEKQDSPRRNLEIIMASKPKRQIIIDGQAVDEGLLEAAEELIHSSPEAAAEVIRRWLKGGA